jgi:membrane-bound metal-dependent hydrolase YbcI (DUF457 family)
MKGLTHFISGAAAATFFRAAVDGALDQQSFILVLGGIFGILPDTLDFKLAQFIARRDVVVDPDPDNLDPTAIARTVKEAAERATAEGREISVQFNTLPLGADLWRQYFIAFDAQAGEVAIRLGPAVTTSHVPMDAGLTDVGAEGRASIDVPFTYSYDGVTSVDIFNGPSFSFRPNRHGEGIEVDFLAWHRRWSHSLTLAAFFGLVVAFLLGPLAGLVAATAYTVHVLEDQLGMMGSNLLWPLTRTRMKGLGIMRSGDALPNFAFVWLSVVTIIFNLNRFHDTPPFSQNPFVFFGLAFVLPMALLVLLGRLTKRLETRTQGPSVSEEEDEAFSEMGETF